MKISIITPTYNSENTIVSNVKSIISQTHKDFEHIIIDNLSTDNTIALIESAYQNVGLLDKLKVISEEDSGISDAFNKGIQNSSAEIIGILSSDDCFFNEFVLDKVDKEFSDDRVLFVHGNVFFKDEIYGSNLRKPLLCPIQNAMPYNHPTMFFKKSVYEKFGKFDKSYKYAMDFELICCFEKLIPRFRDRGKYINGDALVIVSAGGESWKFEIEAIKEVKRALKQHGLWNKNAFVKYFNRIFRTQVKYILEKLNLTPLIKIWRNLKWK